MLHGDIKVNERPIATWTAIRQSYLKGVNEIHEYHCTYNDGQTIVTGLVEHRYSDGAAELVKKIMDLSIDLEPLA